MVRKEIEIHRLEKITIPGTKRDKRNVEAIVENFEELDEDYPVLVEAYSKIAQEYGKIIEAHENKLNQLKDGDIDG